MQTVKTKKFKAFALALIMCVALTPSAIFAADTPSSWAANEVDEAKKAGIVPQSLQSDYTANITRAEFCALAAAMYESHTGEVIKGRVKFDDTNDENVEKMAYLKVVTGVGNNNFNPNGLLTREQSAVMLARLMEAILGHAIPKYSATFTDSKEISDWAIESVGKAQKEEIMGGVGGDRFAPKDPYTREQSIMTVLRVLKRIIAYLESDGAGFVDGEDSETFYFDSETIEMFGGMDDFKEWLMYGLELDAEDYYESVYGEYYMSPAEKVSEGRDWLDGYPVVEKAAETTADTPEKGPLDVIKSDDFDPDNFDRDDFLKDIFESYGLDGLDLDGFDLGNFGK